MVQSYVNGRSGSITPPGEVKTMRGDDGETPDRRQIQRADS
jgi:hypothetical protein